MLRIAMHHNWSHGPRKNEREWVKRVVADRNRITGGGVTWGIDLGLIMASKMRDERFAQMQQLVFEYNPEPPFNWGSPEVASPEIIAHVRERHTVRGDLYKQRALEAQKRLGVRLADARGSFTNSILSATGGTISNV